jgi:aldose 1-epimerase
VRRTTGPGRGTGALRFPAAAKRATFALADAEDAVTPTSIENQDLHLEVLPEAGASVVALAARVRGEWVPILRPTPPEAVAERNSSLMACFALVPWSNRLRDARFRFRGKTYQLRPNTPEGYAIHGDVRKRPWRTVATGTTSLAFAFESSDFADVNFPFAFAARLEYGIDGPCLTTTVELVSRAPDPMPAGIGFHPYYRRTLLHEDEQVEVEAHVERTYEDLVPTSPARPVRPEQDLSRLRALGDQSFDTCFAGWDGRAQVRWPRSGVRVHVACDPPLDHLILFAPPGKPFFALEPVSNANNGFNLAALGDPDAGVHVLPPGGSLRGVFRLTVER